MRRPRRSHPKDKQNTGQRGTKFLKSFQHSTPFPPPKNPKHHHRNHRHSKSHASLNWKTSHAKYSQGSLVVQNKTPTTKTWQNHAPLQGHPRLKPETGATNLNHGYPPRKHGTESDTTDNPPDNPKATPPTPSEMQKEQGPKQRSELDDLPNHWKYLYRNVWYG